MPRPSRRSKKEIIAATDDLKATLALFEISPELSMKDLEEMTSSSRTTLQRRVNELIRQKLLIRIGKGRSIRYRKET